MKHLIPLCLAFCLLTGFTGCEKPTEPKDTPEPDTTSHNFVWRVDTIGTYLSLVRDVAIVDENDIWAVGEFYKKHSTFDSTTKDVYGLCIWDGIKWNFKKVPYRFNGVEEPNSSAQLASIFILKSGVIWMTSNGRTPIRYKNGVFDSFYTSDVTNDRVYFSKIWGLDDTHIWFVGNNGTILFYNGTSFTKIPYDESVDFVDVWGDETGVVRAVAINKNSYLSSIVLLTPISAAVELEGLVNTGNFQVPDIFYTVWWSDPNLLFFGADNGFFKKQNKEYRRLSSYYDPNPVQLQVFYCKGIAVNDVFIVGNYGQVAHYNGNAVHLFTELPISNINTELKAVSVKRDVVCAGGTINGSGGYDQNAGYIVLGKRQN